MKRKDYIKGSRARYRKFFFLSGLSIAICVAVVTGSLVTGDSVRKSLQSRALDRLFGTRSVVLAGDGFLGGEALDELGLGEDSRAVLLSEGFVSRNGRLFPVTVWGMDRLPDGSPIPEGTVAVNREFYSELGGREDPYLVLRLPDEGPVPSSSLFVTGRYTTSMRLNLTRTLEASEGGNLSLKNGQVIPCNVFVNRLELCRTLSLDDKLNLILSPDEIAPESLSALSPGTLGLRQEGGRVLSDGIFLKGNVVDKIASAAPEPNRMYSYLVNSISSAQGSIPYSFATAMDSWDGTPIPGDGAVLSDYAARRLGVGTGDRIEVGYFVQDGLKHLSEEHMSFNVSRIVPLAALAADGGLSADFPGLSDAESCSRWDSDLPIDTGVIGREDEDYWEKYRSTPKILLPYAAMRPHWASSWGDATQIRTSSDDALDCIGAGDFPVTVVQPLDEALANAAGGVDFGGLFLALGCFIIAAALFLLRSPLEEMYALRSSEFKLLRDTGFRTGTIASVLARELLPTALAGAAAGLLLGILYAGGVIFLLGNIWNGATHTDGFALYPGWKALTAGALAGLLLSAGVIFLSIRRAASPRTGKAAEKDGRRQRKAAIACTVLLAVSFTLGFVAKGWSVIIFIIVGSLTLACGLLWACALVYKGSAREASRRSYTLQSLRRDFPEVLSGIIALALGVFITFATGLNRRDFSDASALTAGTGGYGLWCELTVPLQHDISTPEGRARMNLSGLGEDASVMQLTLVGGDDASCLNLNRVTTPAILGFRESDFLEGGFHIKDNIFHASSDSQVLEEMGRGDTVYGLVDETVLTWGLMLQPGDTLHYNGPGGEKVDVVIAGTLPNTVFQGYVLISENALTRHWNERGSRLILLKSGNPDARGLMETALNEYGIRAVPCTERLRELGAVTDTYLTIFLMLGAAGLLLGIFSLIIGVGKRLSGKGKEISLLRSLGFTDRSIAGILKRENALPPVAAVLLGLLAATVSILSSFGAVAPWTWAICLATALTSIILVLLFVGRMCEKTVGNTINDEDPDN